MRKFQNQSLSKAEMNQICGGLTVFACTCNFMEAQTVMWVMPADSTAQDMAGAINSKCSTGGSCGKVSA